VEDVTVGFEAAEMVVAPFDTHDHVSVVRITLPTS
jgi:hypothetical protein